MTCSKGGRSEIGRDVNRSMERIHVGGISIRRGKKQNLSYESNIAERIRKKVAVVILADFFLSSFFLFSLSLLIYIVYQAERIVV